MKTAKDRPSTATLSGWPAVDRSGHAPGPEGSCSAAGAGPRTRRMAAAKIHPAQHVTPVMAQPE